MKITSTIYSDIVEVSKNLGCTVMENEALNKHTSFKIGGPADVFIYVNNINNIKILINLITKKNIPFFILGNGTNLLVSDEGYRGIVLSLIKNNSDIILENNDTLVCNAGTPLAKVCVAALKNNLSGMEFAWGIPGSCGGALSMNAGAYGNDISDIIDEGTHIKLDGLEETLKKKQLQLSYRHSIYSSVPFIITSMKLKLTELDPIKIRAKMYENISRRKNKQPIELPNAGSIFKRPEGYYAGTLIEQCKLKGQSVGGAMVSTKHAGFIVNSNNATAKDVVNLIYLIKDTVYKNTGVNLECEIKTLGNIKL